jgi:hypothetical protein
VWRARRARQVGDDRHRHSGTSRRLPGPRCALMPESAPMPRGYMRGRVQWRTGLAVTTRPTQTRPNLPEACILDGEQCRASNTVPAWRTATAAAQHRRSSGAAAAHPQRITTSAQEPTVLQRRGGAAQRAPSAQHEHGDPGRSVRRQRGAVAARAATGRLQHLAAARRPAAPPLGLPWSRWRSSWWHGVARAST